MTNDEVAEKVAERMAEIPDIIEDLKWLHKHIVRDCIRRLLEKMM